MKSADATMILVYRDAEGSRPAVLEKARLTDRGCWMEIGRTHKREILMDYKGYGGPKPPPVIDHEGIDYGICEKASSVLYYYRGKWLKLTGSD